MDYTVTETEYVFHFIIAAPFLSKNGLFRTYTPIQVPIVADKENNNRTECLQIKLPNIVYADENINFFEADTDDCYIKNCIENLQERQCKSETARVSQWSG